jgi:type IV secretory pathway VirB10-like protein
MAERRHVESKADFFTRLIFDLEGAVVVTALLVMLGTSLWYLLNNDLPKSNEIIISMIIGMIVSKVGTVVDFRYGGSQQSRKQTETNNTLANTAQAAQAALSAATNIGPQVEVPPGGSVTVTAEGTNEDSNLSTRT